ncbi:hypothetical protein C5167_044316 [Papaver somniferum]|uniref:Nucleotide exchange factor Fes1 domain-containing protein n=1 Tax=Papaver somniferum TaxID=3469 RepID=A0A4Y7LAP0_PAPSO|nr:hypothetical protein C5167_044316 [Papaver somniferum]
MEEETQREDNQQQVLKVLEALKQISQDLKNKPTQNLNSNSIKALLELETEGDTILFKDPNLQNLSNHLTKLKQIIHNNHLPNSHTHGIGIRSFIRRRITNHEISKLAESIETEIQAWIDRESVENLVKFVQNSDGDTNEDDEKVKLLTQFENRVLQGFNRDLQDLVLKFKVFNVLETLVCNPKNSLKLKEAAAFAVGGLVEFNKDVFVGEVLMGPIIPALISMGSSTSTCSIQVLCSLIRSIKSPLVDEIETNGQIPKIIKLLGLENEPSIRVTALDCVLEIGYFGRKEAVDAMLEEGLVKKLVELQRSQLGGCLIDMGDFGDDEKVKTSRDRRDREYLEEHPFVSCVSRFWIQLDVGEGLRQREKRAFKLEILQRVREACDCDSDAATILAEVLWGSSL